jgi:hypothetical protein
MTEKAKQNYFVNKIYYIFITKLPNTQIRKHTNMKNKVIMIMMIINLHEVY